MRPRRLLLFLFGICLIPTFAYAKPASLFFTPEETEEIEQSIAENPQAFTVRNFKRLTLESLLYFSPNHWTFWLQGEKWTQETNREGIEIIDVSATTVHLKLIPPLSQETKEIILRANQSYDLATGQVVEGF